MTRVRFTPTLANVENRMNRILNNAFFPPARCAAPNGNLSPVVDIFENDDKIVIRADLPGVKKEDIDIDLKDRTLTLQGERKFGEEIEKDRYYRRERVHGTFKRAFTLPRGVEPEKIEAVFKDGVLSVEIEKPEAQKPKKVTIN